MENILKQFFKYTSLNVLGMIGLSCYILADTFFIARGVGESGLTALNLAIPVYSLINGCGLMIGMGGATKYSIARGGGDDRTAATIFTQALYFALASGTVFFILGILCSGPLAAFLGADATTHANTAAYLKTILLFAPAFLLNNLVLCFVRNDKSPRLAMLAMLLGSFSNVILDYILVFPLKMGMFGAALATGIAPVISLGVLSIHFITGKNRFSYFRCGWEVRSIKTIASLGVSSLITEVSSGVVIIIFNMILLKLAGNLGVAAYGIVANLALVALAIFTGIAQGIQPIISKNYGAGNLKHVNTTLRYALIATAVIALTIYTITFLFTEPIARLFDRENNPVLVATAVSGIRLYFTGFLFAGANIQLAVYFSAVGRPKSAFLLSLLRGFILIIPAAFLLAALFQITGVWLAFPVTEVLAVCFAFFLLYQGMQKLENNNVKEIPKNL